jgi:hypothetical protein
VENPQVLSPKVADVKKPLITVFTLALLLAMMTRLHAQDKVAESPYYPLQVGNTWSYKIKGLNQTVTTKVTKHEKVGDVMCAVVESSADGKSQIEYVAVKDDGVYRYKGMGQTIDPPIRFLKLPAKKGDTWEIESKVGGVITVKGQGTIKEKTEVTVPAGKYKAIVAFNDLEIVGQKLTTTYYFAEKVGMVKQTANFNGIDVIMELEKFEPGKDEK